MPQIRIWSVAACFAAGIQVADLLAPSASVALGSGALGIAILLLVWARHRRQPESKAGEYLPILGPLALVGIISAALVGFGAMGLRSSAIQNGAVRVVNDRIVVVPGVVATDLEDSKFGHRFILRTTSRQRIEVRFYGAPPKVRLGDHVRVTGKISRIQSSDRKVIARIVAHREGAVILSRSHNPMLVASNAFRDGMRGNAVRAIGERRAGLLLGITIGDTRLIPDEVTQNFRDTGLSHLTAVSGANLAMLLAAIVFGLKLLRIPRRGQVITCIVAVLAFTVVARWEPSVLRAAVMATVALMAFYFGRRSQALYALGLGFIGLLAFDPFMLWSIGFQLSFAASLGILLLAPKLVERFKALPRPLAEALAVAIAAQLAVTPLLAVHFERISLVSVPANLVAFSLVAPATVLGFVAGALGPAGGVFYSAAGIFVGALDRVALLFARAPKASLDVDWDAVVLIASLMLLVAFGLWLHRGFRSARWSVAIALAVMTLGGLANATGSSTPDGLRVTFFDVGQGDAALIETSQGARVLIDGGPDPNALARLLSKRGIERIDLMVVSHLHADHVEGLRAVARRQRVVRTWHPGVPGELIDVIARYARVEVPTRTERLVIGDLTVEVVAPQVDQVEAATAEGQQPEGSTLNDASLVLRIGWGRSCVLFTGDLENEGQLRLVDEDPTRIECAVMKAPHHGSGRLENDFVAAVDPEFVAVSVGRNTFGHPTAKALEMFAGVGARVLRTDRMQDITLEMDSSGRVTVG
ncbi:MAG: ComEC/Rec2 family competence protein [Actinomycetota bacterium]